MLSESRVVSQPCSLSLKTIGSSVYVASPNYTVFSWKLGELLGSIGASVKCDSTRRIPDTDFYRVPNASITWSGTKRSDYMVARCALL